MAQSTTKLLSTFSYPKILWLFFLDLHCGSAEIIAIKISFKADVEK